MRWGETIGLERDLLLPTLINVEWQLREIRGRFFRLPPKDDSYRSTNWEPLVPVDLPLPRRAADRPGSKARPAAMRLRRRARRHRPVHVLRPGRAATTGAATSRGGCSAPPATDGTRRRTAGQATWSSWTPQRGRATRSRPGRRRVPGKPFAPPSGRGTPIWSSDGRHGTLPILRARGQAAPGREDRHPQDRRASTARGAESSQPRMLPWPAGCRSRTG